MKPFNKLLMIVAALAAAFALAACGSDDKADTTAAEGDAAAEATSGKGGPDAGEIVFAHSASIPQVVKLPQSLAMDAMADRGYSTKQEYMQTTTDSINAVIRGTATFGNTAPANFFSAVAEGADIVAIAGGGTPDYVLLGKKGLTDICDADRLAINNPVSTTDVLVRAATADCDGGEKEILTIALTPNRLNAITGGQIDATPVQLSAAPLVERQFSDKIDIMDNWAERFSDVVSTVTFVKRSTLTERPQALLDFVEAQQEVIEEIYADPTVLVDATRESVESIDPKDAEAAALNYVDSKVFPLDGGLDQAHLATTVKQLTDTGTLKDEVDPEEYVDRSFIEEALAGGSDGDESGGGEEK